MHAIILENEKANENRIKPFVASHQISLSRGPNYEHQSWKDQSERKLKATAKNIGHAALFETKKQMTPRKELKLNAT